MNKLRFSIRGLFVAVTIVTLLGVPVWTGLRLRCATREIRRLQTELRTLRSEVGYLDESDLSKVVAVRVPADEPMTWKMRVRVPKGGTHQIAYSTLWPAQRTSPEWYGSLPLSEGESFVIVRLVQDPRDNRWKITTLLRHAGNVWRIGTPLSERQIQLFRESHNTVRGGIQSETVVATDQSLRLIEDKWFAGEGGLLMYGESAPDDDMDGVFVELQPASHATDSRSNL